MRSSSVGFEHDQSCVLQWLSRLILNSIGPSGTVKLAKKESAPKTAADKEKKTATAKVGHDVSFIFLPLILSLKKDGATKPAPKKRGAPKKEKTKAAETKKASTVKKTAAPKPKANTASKRKTPVTVCFSSCTPLIQ